MRLLDGLWQDADFVDLRVHAIVAERFLGPGLEQDLHAFVEAGAAFVHGDAEAGIFRRLVASADPEIEPPAAHDVDGCGLLGEPDGVMEGQDNDGGADADPLRAGGHPAGDDHQVSGDAVPLEVVLGQPDGVEAKLLGFLDLLELGPEDVFVVPAGWLLEEVKGAEFHEVSGVQVVGVRFAS